MLVYLYLAGRKRGQEQTECYCCLINFTPVYSANGFLGSAALKFLLFHPYMG